MDRIINSIDSLDGSPLALLLPYGTGVDTVEIIARGIKQIENSSSELFILISPLRNKHNLTFEPTGCSILIKESLQDHPSKLRVDTTYAENLSKIVFAQADQNEEIFLYDIDVVLHALKRIQPHGKIIAIALGTAEFEKAIQLGTTLANDDHAQPPVVIAISKLDNEGLSVAEYCDRQKFSHYVRQRHTARPQINVAYSPVITAMEYANRKGATIFTTITNMEGPAQSDDQGVNLTAAMLWDYQPPLFTSEQKNELISLGLRAIRDFISTRMISKRKTEAEILNRKSGVFVTLRKNSQLKGCIGRMIADEPLAAAVQKISIAAATSDPRFAPLTLDDLKNITIKISVLSPLQRIATHQIEIGKHGLMINHKGHRGVLLPEVPVERNWDRETYLANLCFKAGLPLEILEENPAFYGFTSIEFDNQTPYWKAKQTS